MAQEAVEATKAVQSGLTRGYVRPSLTVAYVTDGSAYSQQVLSEFRKLSTAQFNFNEVNLPIGNITDPTDKGGIEQLKQYAEALFEKHHLGQQIMHCWFPKFDAQQKEYSFDLVAERGAYAATDADVLTAEASKRGKDARLRELGEHMIDRSYVQVIYISTVATKNEPITHITSVLYKLDFGPEVRDTFYERGYNSADGIDKVNFPLNFVGATEPVRLSIASSVYNDEEKLSKELSAGYEELLVYMTKVNSDFQVQSPVAETSPLRAKIGKKEGVKVDDRFFVMEQVLHPDGTVADVRRATFRATADILDNSNKVADGHGEGFTTFYQVAGGGYDRGMTLVSKKDLGMSTIPVIGSNFVGVEVEQRISRYVNLPGTFSYVRIGLPLARKGIEFEKFGPVKVSISDTDKKIVSLIQMGIGVRKEFNFARFLFVSAHLGVDGYALTTKDPISYNSASGETKTMKKALEAYTLGAGARFGVQITPTLGFFAGADYGLTWGKHADFIKDFLELSPFSVSLGARISF